MSFEQNIAKRLSLCVSVWGIRVCESLFFRGIGQVNGVESSNSWDAYIRVDIQFGVHSCCSDCEVGLKFGANVPWAAPGDT